MVISTLATNCRATDRQCNAWSETSVSRVPRQCTAPIHALRLERIYREHSQNISCPSQPVSLTDCREDSRQREARTNCCVRDLSLQAALVCLHQIPAQTKRQKALEWCSH